jgi:predicted transcriptional regulator
MAKKVMNFSLDKSVIEGLRALAMREDRPMSRIVNKTLADHIAGQEQGEKKLETSA